MKNIYNIFLGTIIAISMIVTGCTKIDIDGSITSSEEQTIETFRVAASTTSEGDTKVDVDGLNVTWNESDQIRIVEVGENGEFVTYYTYNIDKESISEDGKYAEFTGASLTVGKQYIAYNYPYSGYISSNSYYGVTNNFVCLYNYSSFDKDNIDLVMQSNIFEYDGESFPQLCFEYKSSILELNIGLDSGSEYTGEIQSIKISASSGDNIFLTTAIFNSYAESVYAFYTTNSDYQYGAGSSITIEFADDAEFSTSTPISIQVPLTWNGYITEANGDFSFTITTANDEESTATKPMQILEDGVRYTADLIFDEPMNMAESDRAALIELYNATDGDNWTNNENWCTDAPLSEWYGVSVDSYDRVYYLYLYNNSLSGSIPESIGELTSLKYLYLGYNSLSGSIPESFGNLTNLIYLYLNSNTLSGSIPESFGDLTNLTDIYLTYNNLSGAIPDRLGDLPYWNKLAWNILNQNSGYGFTSLPDVYLEPSTVTTITNETINTQEFFSSNDLSCVLLWRSWCGWSTYYMETIKELYSSYADQGFGLISLNDEDELSTISTYVTNNNVPGYVCQLSGWDYSEGSNRVKYMPTSSSPTYAFVDSDGKVVFSESIYEFEDPTMSREEATRAFLEDTFAEPSSSTEEDKEESTDYSRDGEVITLQQATVGNGINIVIVGDGFTDSAMDTGGVYETRMSEAMEHFFSEEPYKTYRDRFNVYLVKAVSPNDGVDGINETVFSCAFGSATYISGDDSKVFEYALKVPTISSSNNVLVITVLNSSKYAGTCVMYTDGASIAYCPIVSYNDESFRQIIVHEAGGHGFANLADEYYYSEYGTITSSAIQTLSFWEGYGWYKNIDVTADETEIKWSHLLSDDRYNGFVGIYEGAYKYLYGAYRPSFESIMLDNTGDHNAPSREEIYRRIMERSGDTYDYEEFVSYDAINRSVSSQTYSTTQTQAVDKSTFVPLAPPVAIVGSPIDNK